MFRSGDTAESKLGGRLSVIYATTVQYSRLMTMAQRQFETIQNDPNIARFVVEGTTTGRQLGIGSYGSVEEVHWRLE